MKNYLTWKDKLKIIQEAYEVEFNIKATAQKYGIRSEQIRRWKKKYEQTFESNLLTDSKKQSAMSLKVLHLRQQRKDDEHYDELRLYYDNLRNRDRAVSVGMLVHEWRRLNPALNEVPMITLRNRLYRWMKSEHIVQRRVTRVAQNTRHEQDVIDDFVSYVNEQIACLAIPGSHIVNIDETNIDFDMVSGITLANRGSRTVSVKKSGSDGR